MLYRYSSSLLYIELHIITSHILFIFHVCVYYSTLLTDISVSFSIPSLFIWYHFSAPLHLSLYFPYKMHSNNTCFSVSTSPHIHLLSSYFHTMLSLQTSSPYHQPYFCTHISICKTFFSWIFVHSYIHFLPVCIIKIILPCLFAKLPYSLFSCRCTSSIIHHPHSPLVLPFHSNSL